MKRLSGFSLMEMMIVLAIVAIVAAASAPMINKKMVQESGATDLTWSKDGTSIAFNFNPGDKSYNKTTMNIGGKIPKDVKNPAKLYINTDTTGGQDSTPHISFGSNNDKDKIFNLTAGGKNENIILAHETDLKNTPKYGIYIGKKVSSAASTSTHQTPTNVALNDDQKSPLYQVALGDSTNLVGKYAIAIGQEAKSDVNGVAIGKSAQSDIYGVALGLTSTTKNNCSVALGYNAVTEINAKKAVAVGNATRAYGDDSVSVGSGAQAFQTDSVAIGSESVARQNGSIAIGKGARTSAGEHVGDSNKSVSNTNSIAIGAGAQANLENSVAIGAGAVANAHNQIVLGTSNTTVYIPGKLVIGKSGDGWSSQSSGARLDVQGYVGYYFRDDDSATNGWYRYPGMKSGDNQSQVYGFKTLNQSYTSDRRLKNVGEEFKGGLAEVKKLEVYNYTFKDDKDKTPHVGVMAQDLKKIFPKAVTKGEDGFLRIRMEDMFYALVNAVKELDAILTGHDKRIKELEQQNQEQKEIIAELEKRLEALEKAKK